jgi:hypothetical protein
VQNNIKRGALLYKICRSSVEEKERVITYDGRRRGKDDFYTAKTVLWVRKII